MLLEDKVKQALIYFGPMDRQQIIGKLYMLGLDIEDRDLDLAIRNLMRHNLVRQSDSDSGFLVAKESR
jgi:hypothetical protein